MVEVQNEVLMRSKTFTCVCLSAIDVPVSKANNRANGKVQNQP